MADLNDLIEDSNAKLSRRNVVVGTAWAVPTILAVGAAPAMAATGGATVAVTPIVTGAKLRIVVTVPGYVAGTSVTFGAVTSEGVTMTFNAALAVTLTGVTTTFVANIKEPNKPASPPLQWVMPFTITQGTKATSHVSYFTW